MQIQITLSRRCIHCQKEVFIDGAPLKKGWYYDIASNSVVIEDTSSIVGPELVQIMYDYLGECIL